MKLACFAHRVLKILHAVREMGLFCARGGVLPQGAVRGGAGGALGGEDALAVGGVGAGIQEAFPDDLDGRRGGVDEVVGVEAVVPQFVHHDFVRREGTDIAGARKKSDAGAA